MGVLLHLYVESPSSWRSEIYLNDVLKRAAVADRAEGWLCQEVNLLGGRDPDSTQRRLVMAQPTLLHCVGACTSN